LLVRRRAGIEDVRRSFEPFILTGYQSRPFSSSNTGSIALRLAEVQPPNTVATLSSEISFRAFSANVGQSDAPSSMTGTIFLPSTPPFALISSIASSSASLTDTSLIAIVPLSECRMPTLISPASSPPAPEVSPPPDDEPPPEPDAWLPPDPAFPPQPASASAKASISIIAESQTFLRFLIFPLPDMSYFRTLFLYILPTFVNPIIVTTIFRVNIYDTHSDFGPYSSLFVLSKITLLCYIHVTCPPGPAFGRDGKQR
jgi:Predicted membrane protein